jgi:hypothetical protein
MRAIELSRVGEAINFLRAGVLGVQTNAAYRLPQTSTLINFLKPRINTILEILEECDVYQLQIHLPKAFDALEECHLFLAGEIKP